jgi:O-antigen ligase
LLGETGIPATLLFSGLLGWILGRAVCLLKIWSAVTINSERRQQQQRNRLILFTYVLAFGCLTLFNLFDVTIFDLRVNLFAWVILSAISGMVYRYRKVL